MRLWRLRRRNGMDVNWDEYRGFIVRAKDEETARRIASLASPSDDDALDEPVAPNGSEPWWFDPLLTSCEEIRRNGPPGVILADFNAG